MHDRERGANGAEGDHRYTIYLIVIALAGLALVSYDYNLLVVAIPDIATNLGLSATQVGSLIFFIAAAQLVVTLSVGYALDIVGRRRMWMLCLCAAALFTGFTYFVQRFWQLVVVRMLASSFAQAEFVVSITIVNEEVSARRRGILYSIVQAGWPLGVLLASAVYLLFIGEGWRFIFLLGIVPMTMVIVGRFYVRESDRYRQLEAVRAARRAGDDARVKSLLKRYDVNVAELDAAHHREHAERDLAGGGRRSSLRPVADGVPAAHSAGERLGGDRDLTRPWPRPAPPELALDLQASEPGGLGVPMPRVLPVERLHASGRDPSGQKLVPYTIGQPMVPVDSPIAGNPEDMRLRERCASVAGTYCRRLRDDLGNPCPVHRCRR